MSRNDVEKIKERLNIKEVIESYIRLEKAGKNYKARCPFHNEKTPSFIISPERDNYYCFGCGAKGDIFSFVENFEGTDFLGALKILAEKAGIRIENYSKEVKTEIDRQREILEKTTEFFQFNLDKNEEALKYLKTRGLVDKTIKEWRLGFAPAGWKNLLPHLTAKKFTEAEIDRAGLIKRGDRGDYYDRFRSRIIFPIFSSVGNPTAFSGRIFGEEDGSSAKYLNSPETILFKKSETLYGFHLAKNSIRKNNFSILVEGQMDVLMCHQAGYANTIASSGTALSEEQLKIISRISSKMVIAYDSDGAGFAASERAWQMALKLGMDIKIAPIPNGSDPADVIKNSPEEWREIIKNSKHIIEVLIQKIKDKKLDVREIGQAVSTEIIPYLATIDSKIDRSHFVKRVSEDFDIPEEAIYSEVETSKNINSEKNDGQAVKTRPDDKMSIEKKVFAIISWQRKEKNPAIDIESTENKIKDILGSDEYQKVLDLIGGNLEDMIFSVEDSYEEKDLIRKDVEELLRNLKAKKLIKKREGLLISLRQAEQAGDDKESDGLLKEISQISREIQDNKDLGE